MSTAELRLRNNILEMLKNADEDFVLDLIQTLTSSIIKKHKSDKKQKAKSQVSTDDEKSKEELPEYFKNFKISPKVQAMTFENRAPIEDYKTELEEALTKKYL